MSKISLIKCITATILICIFFISCKKGGATGGTQLELYFESNVLNKNFIVVYANDTGIDLTAKYTGYTFVLLKTDFYHGPLQVSKNSFLATGSWSSNDDYSSLVITLPDNPPEFIFLTRQWRFTSKSIPVLKLAPWFSRDPIELHMLRQ